MTSVDPPQDVGVNMKGESKLRSITAVELPETAVIGFHATSFAAGRQIEKNGFLPSKILPESEHKAMLDVSQRLGIDTGVYVEWLKARCVAFAKEVSSAMTHIARGSSAGQAIQAMLDVANGVEKKGDATEKELAKSIVERLRQLQASPPVIYMVDLSNLGRLVTDNQQPFFYFYWDQSRPLPAASEIGPSRIIGRFDIVRRGSEVSRGWMQ